MLKHLRKSVSFLIALSKDPRIPARDKAVLAGMLALILSPFDIIPDFIPVLGQLDDLMIILLLIDYACNRVPDEVLRDHFPWDAKQLLVWRRRVGFFVNLVPHWVKDKIWKASGRISVVEVPVEDAPAKTGSDSRMETVPVH